MEAPFESCWTLMFLLFRWLNIQPGIQSFDIYAVTNVFSRGLRRYSWLNNHPWINRKALMVYSNTAVYMGGGETVNPVACMIWFLTSFKHLMILLKCFFDSMCRAMQLRLYFQVELRGSMKQCEKLPLNQIQVYVMLLKYNACMQKYPAWRWTL